MSVENPALRKWGLRAVRVGFVVVSLNVDGAVGCAFVDPRRTLHEIALPPFQPYRCGCWARSVRSDSCQLCTDIGGRRNRGQRFPSFSIGHAGGATLRCQCPRVGVQLARGHRLGRHPHLGSEPRWQIGHRALGDDRRPGEGHQRLELRVQRTRGHRLERHPRLGDELWWQLGDRVLGLDRRPDQGHPRLELRVQRTRGHHLGRDPRVGGELGWQLGDRALGDDRRPGQGHPRLELRVQRTRSHHLGRDPRLGDELWWLLGDRALGDDRRPG